MYRSRSIYNNKGPTLLVSYSDQYVRPSVCLSFHLSVRLFEHISSYPNLVYTSSTECLWVKVCSDLEPTFWSKFKFITDLCVNIVVLLAQSTSYVTLREPFYKRLCFDLELYWRSQRSRLMSNSLKNSCPEHILFTLDPTGILLIFHMNIGSSVCKGCEVNKMFRSMAVYWTF